MCSQQPKQEPQNLIEQDAFIKCLNEMLNTTNKKQWLLTELLSVDGPPMQT